MNTDEILSTAEDRIRKHRMSDFRIHLTDSAGAPISRAQAHIRLQRHEFRLGANGFLIQYPATVGEKSGNAFCDENIRRYQDAFADLLHYATLPFYWGSYEAKADQENEERLDRMAAWCLDHGIKAKGHPLVWHEVFPKWAEELPDDKVISRLLDRVSRLTKTFRGKVDIWDVCNESTVAERFNNAVGRWMKAKSAVKCVTEAFCLARAANPDAELIYNDYYVTPVMEKLIEDLQARSVSLNAIGIQSHMHKAIWTTEKLWQSCETYARFGLPIHFTELTILSGRLKPWDEKDWHCQHTDWHSTPEGEETQLQEGRRIYTLLFSHPAVEAITWWDFSDQGAWQTAPAGLLRKDMSLKPLAEWIRKAFRETWSTRETTRTDEAGDLSLHAFFGDYSIRAETDNGVHLKGSCLLSRRGPRDVTVILSPTRSP